MRSLFLSPHSDDETLFGAFTILKHRPHVLICFPSVRDYGSTEDRLAESAFACHALGTTVTGLPSAMGLDGALREADATWMPDVVWAPNVGASHEDHRSLTFAAHRVFGGRVRHYDTYVIGRDGAPLKQRGLPPAPIEQPTWVAAKLAALACYHTQLAHPRASQFFLADLFEYAEQP